MLIVEASDLTLCFVLFNLIGKGKQMKKFLFLCIFGALIFSIIVAWFVAEVHKPLPLTSPVTIELVSGNGIRTLSAVLAQKKLVRHPLIVRLYAKIYGYDTRLKAGEYRLEVGMTLPDVLEKISTGKVVLHRLTLPEGLTTTQILQLIADNPYLSGNITETAAEGELLPETYTFHKGMSRNHIIKNAKTAMQKALQDAWQNRAEDLPLASPQELLILASIVEKETALADERGKVASVFVNRLHKNMLLQTDPTVIYALTLGKKELGRALNRNDLSVDNPYNTYKYAGLPPTPNCNPGLKAIQAAARPEDTPYLYFVADGGGGHKFATNLNEHNRNVQNWRKIRRQK